MKRILFINSPDTDYLQDLTYIGLCKILGAENIIDAPLHKAYHFPRKVYPRNIGYRSKNFIYRMFSNTKKYDAVIVAACSPKCFLNYLEILPTLSSDVPVIFLDGGDWPTIGGDLERLGKRGDLFTEAVKKRPFDLIFKREYLEQESYPSNVHPLPFSIDFDIYPKKKSKKYDVSFWAVESDPIRTKALELLEDQFDCRENGTTRNQIFKKYKRKGRFYLQELSACKVVLNFRGAGWDTLRYWETPAMETFMISQKPQIVIPDNFKHGEHVVYCKDDLSDLIELCEFYIKNDELREKTATAGYKWAKEKHSDIARAQYILDQIQRL